MPDSSRKPTDETEQVLRLDRVHAGVGLVEQQDSRARPRRPARSRAGAGRRRAGCGRVDRAGPRVRTAGAARAPAPPARARRAGTTGPTGASLTQRRRRLALEPDLDVVEDRQVAEQADVLEGPADSHPGDGVGRRAGDVATVERDRAARWPEEPGQEMEQRRLAGAVRTDDAVDRQRGEAQLVVDQRLQAAERLGQPAGLEQRRRVAIGVRSPGLHPAEDTSPPTRVPRPSAERRTRRALVPPRPRRPGSADVAGSVHVDRGPGRVAG